MSEADHARHALITEVPVLTINMPKKNSGEDADPVVVRSSGETWIGVFDGMGGAGSASYDTPTGPATGAFLASRLAAATFENWAKSVAPTQPNNCKRDSIFELLKKEFDVVAERYADQSSSRIRSRMMKAFPTTAAMFGLLATGGGLHFSAMWAGDSRVYLLHPQFGLQQVTRDHLREDVDAQANLSTDSPISNCISSDSPFYIEEINGAAHGPFIAIVATDGCFGYVESPVVFEHQILSAMAKGEHWADCEDALARSIGATTGDDASLAAIVVGWESPRDVRNAFKKRSTYVHNIVEDLRNNEMLVSAASDALAELRVKQSSDREMIWHQYKSAYYLGWRSERTPG